MGTRLAHLEGHDCARKRILVLGLALHIQRLASVLGCVCNGSDLLRIVAVTRQRSLERGLERIDQDRHPVVGQQLRREGAHQLSPSPGPVVVEQVVDPA